MSLTALDFNIVATAVAVCLRGRFLDQFGLCEVAETIGLWRNG